MRPIFLEKKLPKQMQDAQIRKEKRGARKKTSLRPQSAKRAEKEENGDPEEETDERDEPPKPKKKEKLSTPLIKAIQP